MNQDYIARVDEIFRNRWRTLLSVDDMVDNIMTFLRENDMLENTVAMFTSDHGYHLGTFGLPLDKRMPYETDIRYIIVEFAFRDDGHFSEIRVLRSMKSSSKTLQNFLEH